MKRRLNLATLITTLAMGTLFIAPLFVQATTVSFDLYANRTVIDFFQSVMSHLQGVVAFLSVLFIVIAGILYITSAGNSSMTTAAKLCLVGATIGFALALAGPSFLREIKFVVYGDVNASIPTDLGSAPTVADIVEGALSFLLSVIGMLAIIGLTVSSILYIFAMGGTSQAENAKQAMKYSIIGIAIAGASLILIKQIITFFT